MNQEIFRKVKEKNILIAITDAEENVIWESAENPAARLYNTYFYKELPVTRELSVYSNQAGMAVALMAAKIPIKRYYAWRVSQCALKKFHEYGVQVQYEEILPLIKSSKDDTIVCPIEQYLADHSLERTQWAFLKERLTIPKKIPHHVLCRSSGYKDCCTTVSLYL